MAPVPDKDMPHRLVRSFCISTKRFDRTLLLVSFFLFRRPRLSCPMKMHNITAVNCSEQNTHLNSSSRRSDALFFYFKLFFFFFFFFEQSSSSRGKFFEIPSQ